MAKESERVADVAHNARTILNELDNEFEELTGLTKQDVKLLFLAVGLQLTRIYLINEFTKIEEAGKNSLEDYLHERQKEVLSKFESADDIVNMPYHASKELIISTAGVPYDATETLNIKTIDKRESAKTVKNSWSYDFEDFIPEEELGLFKGANHRFSTLGHDPVLGLLFGTINIMTNTITCVKSPIKIGEMAIPILTTNHVLYSDQNKHPMIGIYGSTFVMLEKAIERTIHQPEVLVAALIKQIIHIGTDLFTPCGIQLPGANLVMSNTKVQEITSKISTGDIVKIGTSMKLAEFINFIISALHQLTYNEEDYDNRDIFTVKTKKIIMYSNSIALSSNVILTGANLMGGNIAAIRKLDIGGLLALTKRLTCDKEFIRKVKEEFVLCNFNKLIQGEDLNLEKITWY